MLLLADRNFPGYQLWALAAATGAQLAWRVRKSAVFTPLQVLPDGSFISVLPTPDDARHGWQLRARGRAQAGHRIRVIPYALTVTAAGGTARTEAFRLVTTLLDWKAAPAADLACQEMWAFLAICQALSALEYHAAGQAGIDPDRISFTVTIRIARDHARTQAATLTPQGLARARQHAITDMLADLLPPRRDRHYARVKKRPRNTYPAKKNDEPRPPAKVTYHIQVTRKTPQPPQTP